MKWVNTFASLAFGLATDYVLDSHGIVRNDGWDGTLAFVLICWFWSLLLKAAYGD